MINEDLEFATGVIPDLILPLHQGYRRHDNQGGALCGKVGHDQGHGLDGLSHAHLVSEKTAPPLCLFLLDHPVQTLELKRLEFAGDGLWLRNLGGADDRSCSQAIPHVQHVIMVTHQFGALGLCLGTVNMSGEIDVGWQHMALTLVEATPAGTSPARRRRADSLVVAWAAARRIGSRLLDAAGGTLVKRESRAAAVGGT